MSELMRTPEKRQERSDLLRLMWSDPEYRSKKHKPVIRLDTGEMYESSKAAAEANGVCKSNLSSHLSGKRKSCGGLQFAFVEREIFLASRATIC